MAIIEVKYGSPTVTDEGGVSRSKVAHHVSEIAKLTEAGHKVIVTASGSIAEGRAKHNRRRHAAGLPGLDPRRETDIVKRGYAGKGSASAYTKWEEEAAAYDIETAQVPVTTREAGDIEESEALQELLEHYVELGVVPVINGNDATSPEGAADIAHARDNDKVALLVARLMRVHHLCYLTDVDGLMDHRGVVVPTVSAVNITEAQSFIRDDGNGESGGMRSKVTQAYKFAQAGAHAHIANAWTGLSAVIAGEEGTHFPPH